jgi:hypothetical protein
MWRNIVIQRLIVYHHNLHMWYRVVYIGDMGGIGVLLEVLSRWHKRNIWFLHFNCFFISIWWYMTNFFKKIKQKFSFQISKMKISKFKNENFRDIFHFFQTSIQNGNSFFFFIFFHFLWTFFFQNFKKINSNFKNVFFKNFDFKFSLWHKRIFFLARDCQI